MDLQTMLISVAVTLVSAIVIYLIYACGMRELTYDEVIAEQRRLHQSEFFNKKTEKKDKKEKKKKKAKAEKAALLSNNEVQKVEEEELLVEEEELLPEVTAKVKSEVRVKSPAADVEVPVSGSQSGKKKKRGDKHEPSMLEVAEALHTKEIQKETERSLRQHADQHQEKMTVVKTETTALAPEGKKRKEERDGKMKASPRDTLEAELALEALIQPDTKVSPRGDRDKKNKRSKVAEDPAAGEGTLKSSSTDLIQTLRSASLNDSEIQSMIEVLLNKQGASAPSVEWTKKSQKGDPLSLMRKQLEEKDRALHEEHQFSLTANAKLKDLKQELATERQRYGTLEKSSQLKMDEQMREIQALHARMKSSHDQHATEILALRKKMETMSAGVLAAPDQSQLLHQLKEENKKLKEVAAKAGSDTDMEMKILREKLNLAMTKAAQMENQKFSIEKRMRDQIQKLETSKHDAEDVFHRKQTEVNDELHRAETRNLTLTRDLEKSSASSRQLEQEVANLRNRIKSLETETSQQDKVHSLEARLKESEKSRLEMQKTSEKKLTEVEKLKSDLEKRLQELNHENSMLSRELQTTKERTAGEGQEAPSAEPSGAVHTETSEMQTEKRLIAKDQEISHLQSEVQGHLEEMKRLALELDSQKNKNNALRERNWKAMDALKKAETMAEAATELKADLAERDSKITQLNSQLDKAKNQKHSLEQEVMSLQCSQSSAQPAVSVEEVSRIQELLATTQQQAKVQEDTWRQEVNRLQELLNNSRIEQEQHSNQKLTQLQEKLDKLKATEDSAREEIAHLKEQLNAAASKSNVNEDQYQGEITLLREKLSEAESQHLREVSELQEKLTIKEKDSVNELEKLKFELSAAQSSAESVVRLQSELEQARGASEEVEQLQLQLAQSQGLQTQLDTLQQQLAAAQQEAGLVVELRQQLTTAQVAAGHTEGLQQQLKQAQAAADQLPGLQEQLAKAQTDAAAVEALRTQLNASQAEADRVKQQLAAVSSGGDEAVSALRRELNTAQSQIQGLQAEQTTLQNSTVAREDYDTIKAQLSALQGSTVAQTDYDQLKAELCALQSSSVAQSEYEEVKAELAALQDSTVAQADYENVQKELIAIRQQATEIDRLAAGFHGVQAAPEKDEEVRLLKEQLAAMQASCHSQQEELTQLQTQLAGHTATTDSSPDSQADIAQKLATAETRVTQLEQQLQQHTAAAETLQMESSVTMETTSNNSQLESQLRELKQLKSELAAVKKENHDLRVGCETATKALTKAEKSAEEIAQVQAELKAKAAEVSSLQAELEAMRSKQLVGVAQGSTALTSADSSHTHTHSESHTQSHQHKETHTAHHHMTVLTRTRVEERSSLDVSRILAELDARTAELTVLREVLNQKEHQLQELRSSQNNGSSSAEELTQLRTQVGHLSSQLQDEKAKNDELRMQVKSGGRMGSFLSRSSATVELQEQLEAKQTEIETLRDIVKDYWNKNNDLTEKNELLENEKQQAGVKMGAHLRQQLKDLTAQLEVANEKVSQLEAANEKVSQLEAANEKVSQLEAANEKVSQLEAANEKLCQLLSANAVDVEVASTQDDQQARSSSTSKPELPTELLKRLFPQAKIKSNMTEDEWALTFDREAKKYLASSSKTASQSNGMSPELQDAKQVQAKLQAQVQHYKEVLADTEGILNKLQSSVESEEQKWLQRVKQAEAETKQTKEEVIRLKQQLSDSSNSQDDKIRHLEDKLSVIESERESLQSQLSQSTQSLVSLPSQQAVSIASSQQSLLEEELSTLREHLAEERKSKKELSSANVRLNSLVKIGQDALRAEQEVVKKLQKQIGNRPKTLANGSPTPQSSKGASASNV